MLNKKWNKKAQATIFIIVALVIVAGIAGYFIVKNEARGGEGEFSAVEQFYDLCIENNLKEAVELAGIQGGRVYVPEYIEGSEFAPFSSQLNFLGFSVPYWFYLAGNGIVKEQVPSKNLLEKEIARYLNEHLGECDFSGFNEYEITLGEINTIVKIEENKVSANVKGNLDMAKEDAKARVSSKSIELQNKIGMLLKNALGIYEKQKDEAFLENYTIDVLRNYAPVDGVLIQCAPEVWQAGKVKEELENALEANFAALKFKNPLNKEGYFTINYNAETDARILYSAKWPQALEITGEGAGEGALIAKPVGNQEGLGILGFCYEPYHFVYDWRFPALVQLISGDEIFQFPVVVIIDKNLPRQAAFSEIEEPEDFDLCSNDAKTQEIVIKTYDIGLTPIDSNVKYQCLNQECGLGETKNGVLETKAPACINGQIIAKAEGYATQTQIFSSNEESLAELILDKEYEVNLIVKIDGRELEYKDAQVIVSFDGKNSISVSLPETSKVKLSEGSYNVSVYVYGNSSLTIPATRKTECVEVAKQGLLGLFGGTDEKCFEVELPEMKIERALIGGGKSDAYLLPADLEKAQIILEVSGMKKPNSIDELQANYILFDTKGVEVHS